MVQDIEVPVQLETDGRLRLVFIGTGSAFSKVFYQTNLLIIKGNAHLLVDIGSRAPEALAKLGLSVTKIRTYLITHSHADHIGGLEEVMLVNRYAAHQKSTMIITEEYQKALWDMSLSGGAAFNEEHGGKNLRFEDFFNPQHPLLLPDSAGVDLRETMVGGINIKLFRTRHVPDSTKTWQESFFSYGIIIDDRILFTADTRFDPDLLHILDRRFRFERIFHDCQFFPGGVHASIQELSGLPAGMKRRMFLTHYGDAVREHETEAREAGFAGFANQWVCYDFEVPRRHHNRAAVGRA